MIAVAPTSDVTSDDVTSDGVTAEEVHSVPPCRELEFAAGKVSHRISYFESGAGEQVILCLHGIQSGKKLFLPFLQQPFLRPFRTIAIDLPGFGDSAKPESYSYGIEAQAEAVLTFLRTLGVGGFHLVGHSLGGMIGTLLLEIAPAELRSLVSLEGNLTLEDCGESRRVAAMTPSEFETNRYPELKAGWRNRGNSLLSECLEKIPASVFYTTSGEIVSLSASNRLLEIFRSGNTPRLLVVGGGSSFHTRLEPSGRNGLKQVEVAGADHFSLSRDPRTFAEIARFLEA